MEDEEKKNMENGSAESEPNVETPTVNVEKTYTRDEVNKMINAEKAKVKQAVIDEYENKKAEADKLAKMDEEQKKLYEYQKEKARADKAEKELSAYKLKAETTRQASERGVSIEYLETIDFSKETAESINSKLDIFERVSKAERTKAIEEYSGERPPQSGDRNTNSKPESEMTYEELAKLPKYKD